LINKLNANHDMPVQIIGGDRMHFRNVKPSKTLDLLTDNHDGLFLSNAVTRSFDK